MRGECAEPPFLAQQCDQTLRELEARVLMDNCTEEKIYIYVSMHDITPWFQQDFLLERRGGGGEILTQ